MALKDTTALLKELLSEILRDLEKSAKGNKTAAQRVRVNSIHFEKTAKQYRKESISAEKKGNGKKTSVKKAPAKKKATAKVPQKKK